MADDPTTAAEPPQTPPEHARAKAGLLRRHPWLLALTALPILSFVLGTAYGVWKFHAAKGPDTETVVIIPKGSGVRGTAAVLHKAGVIDSNMLFLVGAKLYGADRKLKAGEYRVPAHATMRDVIALLRSGKTVVRRFTVAEGLSVRQVEALLEREPALSGDPGPMPPEGSLLPETYHFSYGDSRAGMLARMRQAMSRQLAALWEHRARDLPFETPEQAVILASIVEKETSVPAERPRIAGVFINRLRAGMPLQSDPTIIYGMTGGAPLGRPILQSELLADNPYNTYKVLGLPPTPIANPGIDSLKAVLDPMETDELYFVANGTGGHSFSKSYTEHQRNVEIWRAIERQGAARPPAN
jgi:UPF0755 protein